MFGCSHLGCLWFSLIKSELEKLGIQLNYGILCSDSLIGIKSILGGKGENILANPENAGLFKTALIEGQIKGSTSNDCQEGTELTPKDKANVTVSHLNPREPKQTSYLEMSKIKKKLCFSNLSTLTSFKLINLYKHLLGTPPDCLTLLQTTAVVGSDWIQWVQINCYLFLDCKNMWGWLILFWYWCYPVYYL